MRPNVSDISGRNNGFGFVVGGVVNSQIHPDAALAVASHIFCCVGECDAGDVIGQGGGVYAGASNSLFEGVNGATSGAAGRCAEVELELAVIEVEESITVRYACGSQHSGGKVGAPISKLAACPVRISSGLATGVTRVKVAGAGNLIDVVIIFVGFTAYCAEGSRCGYRVELGITVSSGVCLVPASISALDQHGNGEHNNTAEGYCHH